ncbi:S-adenosyl-L-methionine-dependent methyltransferase [Chytridium lagenaria]|nr:S-adenosyl-L-methionine-dependent methyltransferase [Chytridium lagenaria]
MVSGLAYAPALFFSCRGGISLPVFAAVYGAATFVKSETFLFGAMRDYWATFATPPEIMMFLGALWLFVGFSEGVKSTRVLQKGATKAGQKTKVAPQPVAVNDRDVILTLFAALMIGLTLTGIPQCSRSLPKVDMPSFLARTYSKSGYISVVEQQVDSGLVRVLRSDHSIIGGIFVDKKYHGNCIYGSFYFLSFVTDIERPKVIQRRALNIGLGIGVASAELVKRNVTVDVVELDPAVVKYARSHFNLKDVAAYHIRDGRVHLEREAAEKYDYVLHDVFSNGFVHVPLFSVEAMQLIKRVLKPDGILALNYVGRPNDVGTLSVFKTISEVFPNVRVYIENSASDPDIIRNIVYFASVGPLTFKKIKRNGLVVRDMMAKEFPNLEVTLDPTSSQEPPVVIRDSSNVLSKSQKGSQDKHWELMIELFGYNFWLTF